MALTRHARWLIGFSLILSAICFGCKSKERFTANIDEDWPVANVIHLIVNIDHYTEFRHFANAVPYLRGESPGEPVDSSSVHEGIHRYYAMNTLSDVEGIDFSLYVGFDGDKLRDGLELHSTAPPEKAKVFQKKILTALHQEHQYIGSSICRVRNGQESVLCPVLEWKGAGRVFVLRFWPATERWFDGEVHSGITIYIMERGFDRSTFPLVETTSYEKQEVFNNSGLTQILDDVGIELEE